MTCPTCRRAVTRDKNPRFPFCSERCRMADLGRWLGEEYRIPDPADASGGGAEGMPRNDDEA